MGHTLTDPLVERMRGFGTTIFAEMTALAQQTLPVLEKHLTMMRAVAGSG